MTSLRIIANVLLIGLGLGLNSFSMAETVTFSPTQYSSIKTEIIPGEYKDKTEYPDGTDQTVELTDSRSGESVTLILKTRTSAVYFENRFPVQFSPFTESWPYLIYRDRDGIVSSMNLGGNWLPTRQDFVRMSQEFGDVLTQVKNGARIRLTLEMQRSGRQISNVHISLVGASAR